MLPKPETFTLVDDRMFKLIDEYPELDMMDIIILSRIGRIKEFSGTNSAMAKLFHKTSRSIQLHVNKLCYMGLVNKRKKPITYDNNGFEVTFNGRVMELNEDVILPIILAEDEKGDENEDGDK